MERSFTVDAKMETPEGTVTEGLAQLEKAKDALEQLGFGNVTLTIRLPKTTRLDV